MDRRTIPTRVSADVVQYLMTHRDMSLSDIADVLGVTKSFISRVKSRQRSLTVDHLMALERVVGRPLPLLLMEATPREDIPPDLLPLYEATKAVLRSSLRLRKQLAVPTAGRRPKPVATARKRR